MSSRGALPLSRALAALWPAWKDAWILHHDDDLLIVDKPAGVPTHAPEAGRGDDAHARVLAWLRERGDPSPYLGIHHRLDRDTSGVLLFTRRKQANPAVARQFEGRLVDKAYVAAVAALPTGATTTKGPRGRAFEGVLRHRLAPDGEGGMRVVGPRERGGQEAVTRFRVLDAGAPAKGGERRALLELSPETGRTHQIRVQLAAAGCPVAGDRRYHGPPAPRLLLHASALALQHPTTKRRLVVRSPLPAAFAAWREGRIGPALDDIAAVARALRDAADARWAVAHLPGTNAFRLANGGGDGLPGVALDVYGDHLVLSLSSDEALAAEPALLDAAASLGAAGVYVKRRPKHASRIVDARDERFSPSAPLRGEPAPERLVVHELGLAFEVHLGEGLATGVYLDQRENRRRVRAMAKGLCVLNLFAYTGAFTVAAAAGGARATVSVDASRGALAWVRRNLDLLAASPSGSGPGASKADHELVEGDVFVWLEAAATAGRRFDLVLLDPPSFATTKRTRFSAESDYRALAALAYRCVAPSGKLLACTNHRGIRRAKLRRFLHEAARDARRTVAQMKDLPDPVDFPPEPGEEPHLKTVLVTLAG